MNRRKFIVNSAKASAVTLVSIPMINNEVFASVECKDLTSFSQITLPYSFDSLEPYIDKETMNIHYSKHHAAYVKNINEAIKEENIQEKNEISLFKNIDKYSSKARNNAGGAWNHNFFWECMTPGGKPMPRKLSDSIIANFGSIDAFKEQFKKAASTRFGSGWAWLVKDGHSLQIGSSPNQDNPLMSVSDFKGKPLLALDVWEHAYYLHYQNRRADYINAFWNVVDWEFVTKQL